MENEINKDRKVGDLKTGDELSSGAVIVSDPVALTHTPPGQVEIGVRYKDGTTKVQIWRKNTTVKLK